MERTEGLLPVPGRERVIALDVVRGLALWGILLVNMQLFNYPVLYSTLLEMQWWTNPWDIAADYFITIFAEGKFYPVFSFLFGCGFYIFMERAEQKQGAVGRLYLRRMLLLLAFGMLHIIFLWWGDILHFYAVIGVFLLFFRRKSPKVLLVWAIVLLVLPVLLIVFITYPAAVGGGMEPEYWKGVTRYAEKMLESSLAVYSNGDFGEIYRQRMTDFSFSIQNIYLVVPQVLAMFLLGMYASRRRLVQKAAEHRQLLKKVWMGCFVPGVFLVALQVAGKYRLLTGSSSLAELYYFVGTIAGGTAIGLFYITSVLILLQREKWRHRFNLLAPVGRMALTNYILQSIICTTIFYGYGLGLYGRVGQASGIILTLAIFAGQIVFSHLWFNYFHFGPLEWLWRTLTYGKIQLNK
jgi:uncharacterized protein